MEVQGVDAVEAPNGVAVRSIVSEFLHPEEQPTTLYRVRWKNYRRNNEQTEEGRQNLLQEDVPTFLYIYIALFAQFFCK